MKKIVFSILMLISLNSYAELIELDIVTSIHCGGNSSEKRCDFIINKKESPSLPNLFGKTGKDDRVFVTTAAVFYKAMWNNQYDDEYYQSMIAVVVANCETGVYQSTVFSDVERGQPGKKYFASLGDAFVYALSSPKKQASKTSTIGETIQEACSIVSSSKTNIQLPKTEI